MTTTSTTTGTSTGTAIAAIYPIPRPAAGDDPRFTIGLAIDVIAALTRRGYPPITSSRDVTRLQQALFGFIYQEKNPS